ncbi:hypothetical protein K435DRAFT_588968, partial [Dendrothele bispora CBS 962.96]
GTDETYKFDLETKRLPMVGFVDDDEDSAFGFVNPEDVIRAAHLIPAFHLGKTDRIMGPSLSRRESDNDEDWYRYHVGIFSDRDMFARFVPGIGIGH